jgi:hypothetical protein
LLDNPVAYPLTKAQLASPGKMRRVLLFLSGCCRTFGSPETEVSEQL